MFSTALFSEVLVLKDDGFSINIPTNIIFQRDVNSISIILSTPGTVLEITKAWLPWKEVQNGTAQAYIKEANLMMYKTEIVLENVITNNSVIFRYAELKKYSPKNPDYANLVYTSYFQTKKGVYRIVFESSTEIYPVALPEVKSFIYSIEKLK
jgi:hypothetical protein